MHTYMHTYIHPRTYCLFFSFSLSLSLSLSLSSTQRFMGLEPNDAEVKKYGQLSPEAYSLYRHRQMHPNIDLIDYRGEITKENLKK